MMQPTLSKVFQARNVQTENRSVYTMQKNDGIQLIQNEITKKVSSSCNPEVIETEICITTIEISKWTGVRHKKKLNKQ